MDVKEFFQLPVGSGVAAFADAQVRLYRHNPALYDYFLPLQASFGRASAPGSGLPRIGRGVSNRLLTGGYNVARSFRRKFRADVLVCPLPGTRRSAENQFLVRTLTGLVETGSTILCLFPRFAPFRDELAAAFAPQQRSGQVVLLDPVDALNGVAARLLPRAARLRGRSAFNEIREMLGPSFAPPFDAEPEFERVADYVEAWSAMEESIDFGAVVARTHWQLLCSPVCRTALQRGKPAITFQQGVIDHSLDVPVTASKYVAFGSASATFLANMNRSFHRATQSTEPSVDFVSAGCLFDTVLDLPNQFANRTILVFDQSDPHGFYAMDGQRTALLQLTERIVRSRMPGVRVVVRPHPYQPMELALWKELSRTHPGVCELSHAAWTLEDDFRRASVVLGITSGALTVASASGLPTCFLMTDGGFVTGDLAPFQSGQTFFPDNAFEEIRRLTSDESAYAAARSIALSNAKAYYNDGTNLELNASFFERMLQPVR